MHVFSLKCFGVGDGWPNADRNHSAFLYRLGGATLLIDCGEAVGRSLKASGLDYDALDRVLLSHLHFDHVGGFFMLVQGLWLEHRRRPLSVHLPADGAAPLRGMLEAGYLFEDLLGFELRFAPWHAGQGVTIEQTRVTPFPTTHLDELRRAFAPRHPQSFAAYSFLLETDQLRVAHSADLGAVEDLDPLVREPLDLLVCELAHFPPEALFRYLRGRAIKRLALIHVARPLWRDQEALRRRVAAGLDGLPFVIPRDGEEITL